MFDSLYAIPLYGLLLPFKNKHLHFLLIFLHLPLIQIIQWNVEEKTIEKVVLFCYENEIGKHIIQYFKI